MKRRDADRLFHAFLEGRADRRDFIQKLLVAGASVTSVAGLLQACSKQTPKPAAESAAAPQPVAPTAAPAASTASADADLPEMEKELHIANWSDYIAEDTVPKF